ncbi:hypothetical protein, partial [Streptococcus pneumoniae]|uniref:hypothetical protein n=1 Tax=Streptococcus pneumoniae TaxID=1313 RepID=UPI00099F9868
LQKTDFYRPEYQKRKDEICPFSSLAFFQPTTVDKEPQIFKINKKRIISGVQKRDTMRLIDYKISCLFFSN